MVDGLLVQNERQFVCGSTKHFCCVQPGSVFAFLLSRSSWYVKHFVPRLRFAGEGVAGIVTSTTLLSKTTEMGGLEQHTRALFAMPMETFLRYSCTFISDFDVIGGAIHYSSFVIHARFRQRGMDLKLDVLCSRESYVREKGTRRLGGT